jgi:hypothetical protein
MLAIESQQTEELNVALLRRCMSNDPDACHELFTRYNRRIFNTAYRMCIAGSQASGATPKFLLGSAGSP